jgi:addiction module HigA family antidote
MLHYAARRDDLKAPPGNRLEALSGDLKGYHSIRINEQWRKPLNITQKLLANRLGCDVKVINRIVNNRTSISAEMAVKLGSALGTSPEFWFNAQQAVDIHQAKRKVHDIPNRLIQAG